MIEQCQHGIGAVAVVLLMLGVFIGVPVAGLVDSQHMKVLCQNADVAPEVRPTRRTRTTAVQEHDGLLIADTSLVIMQAHIAIASTHLGELRGGFEGQVLMGLGLVDERRHLTLRPSCRRLAARTHGCHT